MFPPLAAAAAAKSLFTISECLAPSFLKCEPLIFFLKSFLAQFFKLRTKGCDP
jgi:hypothetical protein